MRFVAHCVLRIRRIKARQRCAFFHFLHDPRFQPFLRRCGGGHFVDERTLEVNGTRVRGRQVVLAAGARPFVPDIDGLHDVPLHTSDTIMRISDLPDDLPVGAFATVRIVDALGPDLVAEPVTS